MKLKTDMRRSEKMISDMSQIEFILKEAPLGILALSKDDIPYSIPVNFYYENGVIYIHCAKEGQKVSYVKANPQACFLVVHPVDTEDKECTGAMNYESVLCFGRTEFSETSPREILLRLGGKYGVCSEVTDEECKKTALITVRIEEVSAKRGYSTKE
ncbi:MAG: pyridoxamine 5'-phosphate oxidase family protein [Theionarchaea archaeon]|nr:pyridoxamine 5'-phosphate oxidase family protein [Theionarchaea archaeon]